LTHGFGPIYITWIRTFDCQYLALQSTAPLPTFTVGPNTYPGHGRFGFINSGGTGVVVVVQADLNSGLLYDHAVATYPTRP